MIGHKEEIKESEAFLLGGWENTVLASSDRCNRNTMDELAYKQPKFLSHGSGDWLI